MTGSVALDVVIGLVFVYLLYSLLTTTLTEIIASWCQFRASFLAKGIRRMLDDGSGTTIFSEKFFKQPLIKYLGTVNLFGGIKKPAYLSAQNFSKNLFELFREEDRKPLLNIKKGILLNVLEEVNKISPAPIEILEIKKLLEKGIINLEKESYGTLRFPVVEEISRVLTKVTLLASKANIENILEEGEQSLKEAEAKLTARPLIEKIRKILDDPEVEIAQSETVRFIRSLLDDAQNDLEEFKKNLEQWYDDTMERVTGWYKRRIQICTFFIGLGIAITFNADTLSIVNILSKDPKARDQMVQLAAVYIESHPAPKINCQADSCKTSASLDSLLIIKKEIEKDIKGANSVLGLGWDFPDSLILYTIDTVNVRRKKNKSLTFLAVKVNQKGETRFILANGNLDRKAILKLLKTCEDYVVGTDANYTRVSTNKLSFFWSSFFGYLLTAIALSLGAPFWFDILNKLVKLRSSVQVTSQSQSGQQEGSQNKSALPKRVG